MITAQIGTSVDIANPDRRARQLNILTKNGEVRDCTARPSYDIIEYETVAKSSRISGSKNKAINVLDTNAADKDGKCRQLSTQRLDRKPRGIVQGKVAHGNIPQPAVI